MSPQYQRDDNEAFSALKQYLIANYNAKTASGGREVVKRCHICGDSRDPSDAHMYIGLNNGRIVYNCFKCNASGLVDGLFLRNMGCYDPNIIVLAQEQNKKSGGSESPSGNISRVPFTFQHPFFYTTDNEITRKKLEYLEKRLGCMFTIGDAVRFKIVLNLKEFLNANNITKYTRHPDIMEILDKYFIGFLSMDNSFIILRRLVPEGKLPKNIDLRYVNYNIFNLENGGTKFYTVPNYIYINAPLEIHAAEGVFDILSIYNNISPFGTNGLYCAICGKSYNSLLRHLIINYGFMNFNLHLYMDADVSTKDMMRIKDDLKLYGVNIFIHRNIYNNEKDFGVPRDRIIDSISKL